MFTTGKGTNASEAILLDDDDDDEVQILDASPNEAPGRIAPTLWHASSRPTRGDASREPRAQVISLEDEDIPCFDELVKEPAQNNTGSDDLKQQDNVHQGREPVSGVSSKCPKEFVARRQSSSGGGDIDHQTKAEVGTNPTLGEDKSSQHSEQSISALNQQQYQAENRSGFQSGSPVPNVNCVQEDKRIASIESGAGQTSSVGVRSAVEDSTSSIPKVLEQRLGFAALDTARDDPRYAHLCAPDGGNESWLANGADDEGALFCTPPPNPILPPETSANTAPNSQKSTRDTSHQEHKSPHTKSTDPLKNVSPAIGTEPKLRAYRPSKRKVSPPPPIAKVLSSNRKRPLSDIPHGVLYKPGQIVSKEGYENAKRLRLEKKLSRKVQEHQEPPVNSNDTAFDANFKENGSSVGGAHDKTAELSVGTDENMVEVQQEVAQVITPPESDHGCDKSLDEVESESTKSPEESPAEVTLPPLLEQSPPIARAPAAPRAGKQKHVSFDLDTQSPPATTNNDTAAEYESALPVSRPTTGGKGLSAATKAKLKAEKDREQAEQWAPVKLESVYHYFVCRREREANADDDDADERTLGPFCTIEEANTVAKDEASRPTDLDGLDSVANRGWNHWFQQDDVGMQSYVVEVCGIHVETSVHREPAPPPTFGFPSSAYRIPVRLHIAQELTTYPQHPPSSSPTTENPPSAPALPYAQTITHGAYTDLEHANRKAGEQWLEALTGAWSDFGAEGLKKSRVERELKADLREMNEAGEGFCREVAFAGAGGGVCRIWVESVEVCGARN